MKFERWLRTTSVIALIPKTLPQLKRQEAPPQEQWARGFLENKAIRRV